MRRFVNADGEYEGNDLEGDVNVMEGHWQLRNLRI
jgi:hypothetical protein